MADSVTANEMAREAGVNPKTFRAALRNEKFHWHKHYERWEVERGSKPHEDMRRVLERLKH